MGAVQMVHEELVNGVSVQVIEAGKRSKKVRMKHVITDPGPLDFEGQVEAPSADGDRRTAKERIEDEQRARAREVAMTQPHRRDAEDPLDPLCGTAHGRFCLRSWPGQDRRTHRLMMFNAGEDYARDVRDAKIARGLATAGGDIRTGTGGADDVSQRAIEDAREQIEICDAAVRSADEAMMLIGHGTRPRDAIKRLCCNDEEPRTYDGDLIQAALYRLAVHYGKVERTINSGSRS